MLFFCNTSSYFVTWWWKSCREPGCSTLSRWRRTWTCPWSLRPRHRQNRPWRTSPVPGLRPLFRNCSLSKKQWRNENTEVCTYKCFWNVFTKLMVFKVTKTYYSLKIYDQKYLVKICPLFWTLLPCRGLQCGRTAGAKWRCKLCPRIPCPDPPWTKSSSWCIPRAGNIMQLL